MSQKMQSVYIQRLQWKNLKNGQTISKSTLVLICKTKVSIKESLVYLVFQFVLLSKNYYASTDFNKFGRHAWKLHEVMFCALDLHKGCYLKGEMCFHFIITCIPCINILAKLVENLIKLHHMKAMFHIHDLGYFQVKIPFPSIIICQDIIK